jgi:subtilisin-like proprotein convertase family protein
LAGFHFHNYYGFGLVNTEAAINMATQNYTFLPSEVSTGFKPSAALNLSIPANDVSGVTNDINVAESYTIEAVQIKPHILHTNIGEVGIEITSPSGTKSIVVNINNTLTGLSDFDGEVFLTNAFYGENSAGNWTIKVIDGASTGGGTLVDWSINIIGH